MKFVILLLLCGMVKSEVCTKQPDCFSCVSFGCRFIQLNLVWKCVPMSIHADIMVTRARSCRRLQREEQTSTTSESSPTLQSVTISPPTAIHKTEKPVRQNTTSSDSHANDYVFFNDAVNSNGKEPVSTKAQSEDLINLFENAEKSLSTACKKTQPDVKIALSLCRVQLLVSKQKDAMKLTLTDFNDMMEPHKPRCEKLIKSRRLCRQQQH